MIRGRLRPLTKNATNGTYAKYYPSVAFFAESRHPSDNKYFLLIEVVFIEKIEKIGKMRRIGV